jgi:hypothetical protein
MNILSLGRIAFFLAALFLSVTHLSANSEEREWQAKDGSKFSAEIASVDEANQIVKLRLFGGKEISMAFGDLSALDKSWLFEWIEMNEELMAKVKEYGGRLERMDDKEGKGIPGFFIYHPSGEVNPQKPRALMFLFDPSGNPARYILRHMEAAEKTKMTIICSETFRNGQNMVEMSKKLDTMLPLIGSTVPYDKNRFFLGGTSGGAMSAFHISAYLLKTKFAGIYSNVGWLGGAGVEKQAYPAYRVALVNGDKDHAVAGVMNPEIVILQERGCTVSLFAFEGGHQIPPPSVQIKAFRWLLGETE